jgi:hypothetical protein
LHVNGAYKRLSEQLTETETRVNARLDQLQSKIDLILQAAGLVPELPALGSGVVEVLDSDMQPVPPSAPLAIALPSKPVKARQKAEAQP